VTRGGGEGGVERAPLTAVVIARNASATLARTLSSLTFAADVLVVDGGSSDDTAEVAERCGARVVVNPWPGFAAQRRFGLEQARFDWVFACDADEVVSAELAREMAAVVTRDDGTPGWCVLRRNQFLGAWMDVGPWSRDYQLRLMRRSGARVSDAAVHEGYAVEGETRSLNAPLLHYTHATLAETAERMNRYTTLEARDRARRRRVGVLDPLFPPAGVFVNYYVLKGCWRAGVRGFLLAATTAMYKSVLYVKTRELQRAGAEVSRG